MRSSILAALCLVAVASAEEIDYQPKPLPHDAKAYSWRMFNLAYRAWLDAGRLTAFRAANAGKPWLASGEAMVARADQVAAWTPGASYPNAEWKRDVDAMVAAGCDDAWVLGVAADFARDEQDGVVALRLYKRAVAAPDFPAYPAQDRWNIRARLLDLGERRKLNADSRAMVAGEIDDAWAMLTEPTSDRLVADRRALEELTTAFDPRHDEQRQMLTDKKIAATLDDALLAKLDGDDGKVTPWVRDTIRGVIHTRLAWDARGRGWAKSVTPEGWKGFAEHLARARELLTAAWKAKPDQPFAACSMIPVCMGQSSGFLEERMWFDRCLAAQFDYNSCWDLLRSAYEPRWGGDYEATIDLGVEAAQTKRFDSRVPMELLECVLEVDDDLRGYAKQPDAADKLWTVPELWTALKDVFEGYRSAKDRWVSWQADHWDSWYAACAWKAGDRDLAAKILAGVKAPEPWPFERLGVSMDEIRAHAPAEKLPAFP